MSILDELEDITDANTFGYRAVYGGKVATKKPVGEFCGRGHPRSEENMCIRRSKGRIRIVCRVCRRLVETARREG